MTIATHKNILEVLFTIRSEILASILYASEDLVCSHVLDNVNMSKKFQILKSLNNKYQVVQTKLNLVTILNS